MMVIITLNCHLNGQFTVTKNLGGFHESKVFTTRAAADGHAMQLHAEAGGPDNAKIEVHDLPRAAATKPLGPPSTV